MAQSMLANIEAKTGRSLQAWRILVAKEGPEAPLKHGQIVTFLKSQHGVTHGFANLIAHELLESAALHSAPADLVETQYAGKTNLRPIYDRILTAVGKFGRDVDVSPRKTYVTLRRKKQFALVKPATKTRVDIGIQLKGHAGTDRLVLLNAGKMTSHQVSVTRPNEVDQELVGWLEQAYSAAD